MDKISHDGGRDSSKDYVIDDVIIKQALQNCAVTKDFKQHRPRKQKRHGCGIDLWVFVYPKSIFFLTCLFHI